MALAGNSVSIVGSVNSRFGPITARVDATLQAARGIAVDDALVVDTSDVSGTEVDVHRMLRRTPAHACRREVATAAAGTARGIRRARVSDVRVKVTTTANRSVETLEGCGSLSPTTERSKKHGATTQRTSPAEEGFEVGVDLDI